MGGPGCACMMAGERGDVTQNEQCRIRIAELLHEWDLGRERLEGHRRKRDEEQEKWLLNWTTEDRDKTVKKRGVALQAKLLVEVEQEVRGKIRAQRSLRGESRKRGAAESPDELQWSRRMAKRNSAVPVACSEDCQESRKRSPEVETEALKLDIDDVVIKSIGESQVATSSSSSSTMW